MNQPLCLRFEVAKKNGLSKESFTVGAILCEKQVKNLAMCPNFKVYSYRGMVVTKRGGNCIDSRATKH